MNTRDLTQAALKNIKNLIRNTSAHALKAMSQKKEIQVEDVLIKNKILGHWMTLISVSGEQLHITFKVQFSIDMARNFATQVLGNHKNDISNSHSKDFIREFCNLVAGNIKNKLSENNIVVGISLPLLSRGFDDLFFAATERAEASHDRWALTHYDCSVFCSTDIQIAADLHLPENIDQITSSSGEVEFF